jgi:hypothetical protein
MTIQVLSVSFLYLIFSIPFNPKNISTFLIPQLAMAIDDGSELCPVEYVVIIANMSLPYPSKTPTLFVSKFNISLQETSLKII